MKKMILIALFLSLVAGVTGCQTTPAPPIKIGISAWAGVEPAELAARLGLYEKHGVKVKMVRFSAYTDSIEAFRDGKVDIDMLTFDDAIRLKAIGKLMKVVLFTDYSYGGDGVVAQGDINSVVDLKGRKVGVEIGTVGHLSLLKALDTAGLTEEDITIVSIPVWRIKEAFLAKQIDAGVTWEPYLTSSAQEGGGKVIITSRDYPKQIVTTMAVGDEVIQKRSNDVQKIVAAYFEALQYIFEHPDDAYAIMAEAEEVTAAEFVSHVEGIRFISLVENKTAFGVSRDGYMYQLGQELAGFLQEKGVVKNKPAMSDLLDGTFVLKLK